MNTRTLLAGIGFISLLVWSFSALGATTVHFVEPTRYADAGDREYDSTRNLATLQRHLVKLGDACLGADENLELRVLDVDLAGREEWWHGPSYDLRVMRDITWPRIEVEYVWTDAAGALLGQGQERITDMNYLSRSAYVRSRSSDSLPYEKAMLRDWFDRRFCNDRRE
jgi:hypothetical protein